MDLIGLLINSIINGASDIDKGRKYLATDGFEHAGRLSYEEGISTALETFKNAQSSADPLIMVSAETTYPTAPKYRYHGFPRDVVHLACAAHRTRLKNSLRTPGINMIEKSVLTQRAANMTAIQAAYTEKQRKSLG